MLRAKIDLRVRPLKPRVNRHGDRDQSEAQAAAVRMPPRTDMMLFIGTRFSNLYT